MEKKNKDLSHVFKELFLCNTEFIKQVAKHFIVFFHNEFIKFINTETRIDIFWLQYHMTLSLFWYRILT